MSVAKIFSTISMALMGLTIAGGAYAQQALEAIGKPVNGAMGFQPAGTGIARDVHWLDSFILYIITAIVIFVTVLLLICLVRFNSKANPKPARFTHNSALEIVWTLAPIIILIAMIPPSLTLLFKQEIIPKADVTIKATGNQWYWNYTYVDSNFDFDSYMIGQPATLPDNLADQAYKKTPAIVGLLKEKGYAEDEFLLATDEAMVIPVNKTIVVQVTGADVIHSWTVPAFGVKQDAVPGRLAELWFKADKIGIYFGQCSQLCGKDHAYMPIEVKVVSQADYEKWLNDAKNRFAGSPGNMIVASAN